MENTTPNTNNFLNWVEIKNFKSIKDLRLDCKRVNVFIGKPNVGKSNILEGLGLLGASYNDDKYLSGAVRYNEIRELFRDNNPEDSIGVLTDKINAFLERTDLGENTTEDRFDLRRESGFSTYRSFTLNNTGKVSTLSAGIFNERGERDHFETYRTSPIKKYDFKQLDNFKNTFSQYLLPPHGGNLYAVIDRNPNLWQEFAKLFQDQNLEFVLSDHEQSFVLQKKEGSRVKQYPYFSIADTFRRFMFYITAIESNKNSVIVFEEPEVHSFPPYTQEMAYRMIYDEANQYFISTHSPYMLHPFIEKMDYQDLNVFITYYKDYQTHVRALTEEELTDILDYGTNVFFNLRKFEPDA
ncbi:MAG: ATPase [Pedobacter sp.]|nr:MAG: ATPase [Pedobacter sp.]